MEEWDLEEDGTGAVSQLTSFQKEVLHALAAYDDKYTARALTDFAHGTVDEVSRALDALCDADIVTRSGSGGDDELFWVGEEPDGEPIMEPGAAPAGWQQPSRPQQSGGRAKPPAKTKTDCYNYALRPSLGSLSSSKFKLQISTQFSRLRT